MTMVLQITTDENVHRFEGDDLRALVIAAEPTFRDHCIGTIGVGAAGLSEKQIRHVVTYLAGVAQEENCVKHMEMKPWSLKP